MNTKIGKSILAGTVVAMLLTAGMTFARAHHPQKSGDVDLLQTTKVPGGPTLKAGTYKVTLLNDSGTPELEFYQEGKLVGQAPVKLVDQDKKITETEVLANDSADHTQVVTEMDLSGWTQKVVFSGSDEASGSGE